MVGIIPGRSEPEDLDPYIDILVDEIIEYNGCLCFDAYKNEQFRLRLSIIMHVLDYPGQCKLFHCGGKLKVENS